MATDVDYQKYREMFAKQVWPKGLKERGLECPDNEHLAYFYADKRMNRAKKGLFLYGFTGTGKTTIMRVLHDRFKIPIFSAITIVNEYMEPDGEQCYRYLCERFEDQEIIIDDLGAERKVKKFGNESIICDFIDFREKVFQRDGILTHITSNIVIAEEIAERYGDRVLSRIAGMCDVVLLDGTDRRRI